MRRCCWLILDIDWIQESVGIMVQHETDSNSVLSSSRTMTSVGLDVSTSHGMIIIRRSLTVLKCIPYKMRGKLARSYL